MIIKLHKRARTTPAIRKEIRESSLSERELARQYVTVHPPPPRSRPSPIDVMSDMHFNNESMNAIERVAAHG